MMNCTYVQRNLPEYIYHGLPSKLMERVENHIRRCRSCRTDFEILSRPMPIKEKSLPTIPASYTLKLRLNRMIESEPTPAGRRQFSFNSLFRKIAFGLALVAAFIFLYSGFFEWVFIQNLNLVTLISFFLMLICVFLLFILQANRVEAENGK
ncbi:zf-HC2 domain-containing protein [candidate division KSB1 bacterium]|nr:zf-HC2 domain-containing protein [candidate division KSB1 bacterium]